MTEPALWTEEFYPLLCGLLKYNICIQQTPVTGASSSTRVSFPRRASWKQPLFGAPCWAPERALNRILKNKEFIEINILSLRIVIGSYLSSQHSDWPFLELFQK